APDIATVDSNRVVTGVSAGRAVITAEARIGGKRVRANPVTLTVTR
ncbi:MAG: hypothetical protein QOF58_6301, partial [Pseudonocardiales bacterium]|nr:hypothetical protein [Pseudonocardiales bacterium]